MAHRCLIVWIYLVTIVARDSELKINKLMCHQLKIFKILNWKIEQYFL